MYNESKDIFYGPLLLIICTIIPLIVEFKFRRWENRDEREIHSKKSKIPSITLKSFNNAVYKKKKHYVVLDNFVLNLKSYYRVHPGGRFVLEKNYGRDIAKFFYGGYQLVNPKDPNHQNFHNHGAIATKICESMVLATFKG